MSPQRRKQIINNLLWVLSSILLAVIVWVVATLQVNPIIQEPFNRRPVSVLTEEGIIVTSPTRLVNLVARGQRSVLEVLDASEIRVIADARGLQSGTHSVTLQAEADEPLSAVIDPPSVEIILAQEIGEQKPVQISVEAPPPVNFRFDPPITDIAQAEVRGAANLVASVASVQGEVDLRDLRTPYETVVTLAAVDAEGNEVEDVEIIPVEASVSVNIVPRDDVIAVTVVPLIQVDTVSTNFVFGGFSYSAFDDGRRFLSGDPDVLATIRDTVQTNPIDLSDQMDSFEATVPIDLPHEDLEVLNSAGNVVNPTIGVRVVIVPRTTTQPYENVPIELRNVPEGLMVTNPPQSLFVLLDGPVTVLDELAVDELFAVVDLADATAGTSEVQPTLVIRQGQIDSDDSNITATLIPEILTVTLVEQVPEATAAVTEASDAAATATDQP